MLSSLADNTKKQYNVCYKLWWEFCYSISIYPLDGSVSNVLSFLTCQFNKGASYGTINSHRSALSLLLGSSIGTNEYIKRFLKGVFREKPIKPKYSDTWDPQIVLQWLSKLGANTELSMELLNKKLVTLLALCTAQRVQTLSLIKLNNINFYADGIKIKITDHIKTSAVNRQQPLLWLPYFKSNLSICPATAIIDYISRTKSLRKNINADNLILTSKKPYKPASSQSISRWIKQVLSESGIDISVFGAHSTRHASTSSARAAGVGIEVIRKTAGWTSNSIVFAKFYQLPIINSNSNFAQSVCLKD